MQLTVEGYCQNEEMRALLEAAFSELKMKGPPEYSYSRLNYLVKCDIAKAPTQLVADYHAVVKKKNLDSLDKANDNKGLYQQFYTKRLLEMKADPAYDSYSQHDKDREIGNSWLHAEENPNADHKIEEQLDRYCASTSKSKRKARVAKKETKKDMASTSTLSTPAAPAPASNPSAMSGSSLSLDSDKDNSDDEWEALELEGDFALWGNQLHLSQACRLLHEAGSDTQWGDDEGGLASDDNSPQEAGNRGGQPIPSLDNFLLPPSTSPRLDRRNGLKRLSASNNCNNGNNSDSDNEDNNHDGNYSDGAASNDTCPEEPNTIVAALEAQVLDQGANTAAGRPAVVTQQNGAARYTNPIKPGQALVPAGSCTLHCIVGLLTVPLAYKVLLYRPSLTFARELVAQHPPRTKIMVNLISDAGRAASTRVGQASNDAVQRNLFGAGTPGIFTVISRILPAASSRHAFEARLSVYFDGSAHDASAVASALLAAGASLGHFRVVAPSSILSKRQERLLARLCGPAHAAAERTFSLKRTAMSPFAPACAREMYKKRLRVS